MECVLILHNIPGIILHNIPGIILHNILGILCNIRAHSIIDYSGLGYSRRYNREYPTGNLELSIPDIGYSQR